MASGREGSRANCATPPGGSTYFTYDANTDSPLTKVTPRGTGYKVAMTFESLDEALEFASRVRTVEPV